MSAPGVGANGMSDDEFDRLVKSSAGRALGLTEAHRAAYVANNHAPEPIEQPHTSDGDTAESPDADDDDGYDYPPTVAISDAMRSPLPPRHEVELWHDTTMWNEGFEQARDAITTVAVSTDADRDALVAWVEAQFGLLTSNNRRADQVFATRVHAAYPEADALTLDGAKQVFQTVTDAWDGI